MKNPAAPKKLDYLALAVVSGAGLAYEILLLRVFSYSQWHHFASLAVSLALLGFGAAGTLLALLGKRAVRWGDGFFLTGLMVGGAGMVGAFLLPQAFMVRPLFAVWDLRELGKLLLIDFVSFIPFFGLALCIGQVFMRWPEQTPRLYAANLFGSGAGSLLSSFLLTSFFLETALLIVPLVTLGAGALLAFYKQHRAAGGVAFGGVVCIGTWMAVGLPGLPVSDFKRLSYLLDLPGAEVIEERPGLRAKATVIRSDSIRISPGLSLQWMESIPSQDALVLGSDRALPLPHDASAAAGADYFDATLGQAPFQLRPDGPVAVLGTSEWLGFLRSPERDTVWIENNPQVVDLFRSRGLPDRVSTRHGDARQFLRTTEARFSIIFLEAAAEEGDAASEDYALTVEALEQALERLEPGGILAIPLRLSNPPRRAPKLLAMARSALGEGALAKAAMLRSMQEGLVLLSNEELTVADRNVLRAFSGEWDFDLAALPGLEREEANRFHRLAGPVFFDTAQALLAGEGEGEVPSDADWYSITPATDLQPYFWQSMKWRNLPRLWGEFGRQGLMWLDWALLAIAAKLIVAGGLAVLLVLLPLGKLPRGRGRASRSRVWIYFTSLGLGFLLFEMAIFQRSTYFLAHPVVAASLVFAVFLIGSGIGSYTAPVASRRGIERRIFPVVLGFAGLSFILLFFAESVAWWMPGWMRMVLLAVSVLPLAWSLGRPMPWGLRQLDAARPLIPWAWGINGFASVLAAPLAALLSVHASQLATWLAGGICYAVAWGVAASWTGYPSDESGSA